MRRELFVSIMDAVATFDPWFVQGVDVVGMLGLSELNSELNNKLAANSMAELAANSMAELAANSMAELAANSMAELAANSMATNSMGEFDGIRWHNPTATIPAKNSKP
jgi:hypothetical protein